MCWILIKNQDMLFEIPEIVEILKSKTVPRIVKELDRVVVDGICMRKVVFLSHVLDGMNSEVYGIIASPKNPGSYPAIQFLHGGGGNAWEDKAIEYAKAGYIILVQELPGICSIENAPYTNGPWRKRLHNDDEFFALQGDVTNTRLYEAIIAAIRGFYLLCGQPGVIKERVVMDEHDIATSSIIFSWSTSFINTDNKNQ